MNQEAPDQKQPESVLEKRERVIKLLLEAARLHRENPEKGNVYFGVITKLTGSDVVLDQYGNSPEELWHQEASVAELRDDVVLFAEGYEVPLYLIEEVELIDE